MKNIVLFLSLLLLSHNAFSSELNFTCAFEEDGEIETIMAKSTEYDFDDTFQSGFMPTSSFFEGKTPDLYVVSGKAVSSQQTEEMDFFTTMDLPLENYTKDAQQLLIDYVQDLSLVKSVQLAFPTNLYHTFVYINVKLVNGSSLKLAVAGMSMTMCQ